MSLSPLPESVSSVPGTVAVLLGEAGLVSAESTHCFFRLSDCWDCGPRLRVGSRVHLNARLCPESARLARVPYICSSLWEESTSLPSALALRVLRPPGPRELAQYKATVPGLEPLEELESQLATSIEELEKKKKKRQKSTPGGELKVKFEEIKVKIEELESQLAASIEEQEKNTKKRRGSSHGLRDRHRDQRKRIIKMCVKKIRDIRDIDDPETVLCRAVLINNTFRTLKTAQLN